MQTTAERRQGARRALPGWGLLGAALGTAAGLGLMYISALLLINGKLPEDAAGYAVTASVFCGATLAGAAAAKARGRGEAEAGLICGVLLAALIALASLIIPGGNLFTAAFVRYALSAAAGGLFGGTLCVKRGGGRRKSRRRR